MTVKNKFFLFFLILIFQNNFAQINSDNNFVIVIPSYKNKDWYKYNLNSVFSQKYQNYRVIYIDDCSPDGTYDLVKNYIKKLGFSEKIKLIRNQSRQGALANFYSAIHSCHDDEIIICLDGDDWFANNNVLNYLNEVYKNKEIWITYGQFAFWPSYNVGFCKQISNEIISKNLFREQNWIFSHLKTFYAGLFKRINNKDLLFNGEFFPMCSDVAFMLPMLEMAGQHIKFIQDVLYIYNISNPLNDHNNRKLQIQIEQTIKKQPKYKPIDRFFKKQNNFVVVIPSYKNKDWYKYNLNSVFSQIYDNYRVIYIDDCSPDGTYNLVKKYIKKLGFNKKVTLVKNEKRQGSLANHYKAIHMCNDDEIIICLDGDDWFANDYVLDFYNEIYNDSNVWFTYGQFCNWPTGEMGWCKPYSQECIKNNNFRRTGFFVGQPRTYYAWLAKLIKLEDLLDDEGSFQGKFYPVACDVALAIPMLEMAGERFKFIPTVLTQRNVATQINDFKINFDLLQKTTRKILNKPKYKRLNSNQIPKN